MKVIKYYVLLEYINLCIKFIFILIDFLIYYKNNYFYVFIF